MVTQERQEHTDLGTKFATIESKLNDQTVSTSTAQPSTSLPRAQTHQITKTPFKMEIPSF